MSPVHHVQGKPWHAAASRRHAGRTAVARLGAAVLAAGTVAGVVAAAGPADASTARAAQAGAGAAVSYHFRTLNNSNDLTFNQLLGINNLGKIAGYFGSGAKGHRNKGYVLLPPYRQRDYRVENFPRSAQTQVTGLNDHGVTVGFWSRQNNANLVNNNFGFYATGNRRFHSVNFPTANNSKPPVNQLLGVNDHGVAVGFYNDSKGNAHGYTYNIRTKRFRRVRVPGATSVTAAAINNKGSIAGFFTTAKGKVKVFFRRHNGQLIIFSRRGAAMTQAFGVNDSGEVVGAWTTKSGASHGFTWTIRRGFRRVDDPKGIGTTVVNGVNDAGDLVGFYTGKGGHTNGMLATP